MSVTSPTDAYDSPPPRDGGLIEVILGGRHHRRAARARDISAAGGAAIVASRLVVASTACELYGWAIRETTGAAVAAFRLWDGNAINTALMANCNLAANESDRDWFGPQGVCVETGHIFIEVVSGSIEGVVYWR